MLKVWLGRDGGSIIVSKSEPQHDLMQALGFKLVIGVRYSNTNRLDVSDYHMVRAVDYLGNDAIYRCMRINDGIDEKYIAIKKDRYFKSKQKQEKKIIVSPDGVFSVAEVDQKYLACAACKRIFRNGKYNRYIYDITFKDPQTDNMIGWKFRNIECCDKYYVIGDNPNETDYSLVYCTTKELFNGRFTSNMEIKSDEQKMIVEYITCRKGAKKIERDGNSVRPAQV